MTDYKRLAAQKEAQLDSVREALLVYFDVDPDAPEYTESELPDARAALIAAYAIVNREDTP